MGARGTAQPRAREEGTRRLLLVLVCVLLAGYRIEGWVYGNTRPPSRHKQHTPRIRPRTPGPSASPRPPWRSTWLLATATGPSDDKENGGPQPSNGATRIELTDWMTEVKGTPNRRRKKEPHHHPPDASPPSSSSSSASTDLGSVDPQQQLPVKLQREVNLVWFEIQQGDRMAYLPEEDQARLKQQLVVLAFFRTLFEHPGQVLSTQSAEDCFLQADEDRNGQLSFEEFLKWYRASHDGSSTTTTNAKPSPSKSTALVPFGQGAVARSLEGVAMKDLLRQFWAEKQRSATQPAADKSEEEVLEDLDRVIETTQVLLELQADADTVLAALATHFLGLDREGDGDRTEKLAVVSAQCGPIVHQIVQDSSRLGGLFQAPPEVTQHRRNLREYQALLDLDHHNAQLAREYLMAANSDARAFVVHMAGLVYALRNQYRLPVHERHLLALESLQLYVPVASALGLGSRLKEMEELSYKALFPESYERFASWHKDFLDMGQVALLMARKRIAAHIEADVAGLRQYLDGYEIHGRVKSVVSAFKKVYRKDKLPEELHDMLGLRIILTPTLRSSTSRGLLRGKRSRGGNVLPVRSAAAAAAAAAVAVVEKAEEEEEEESVGSDGGGGGLVLAPSSEGGNDFEAWLCHRVHDVVLSLWEEVPGRYKNYVDDPKQNGYRSIHNGIFLMDGGGAAEVQIRTASMHYEAEEGVASHALYKADLQTADQVAQFQQQLGGQTVGVPAATSSKGGGKVMKQALLLPAATSSASSSSSAVVPKEMELVPEAPPDAW